MNKRRDYILVFFLLVLFFIFNICCSFHNKKYNTELRDELLKMGELDQNVRIRYGKVTFKNKEHLKENETFLPKERMDGEGKRVFEIIKNVDENNTKRLKEIINEYGWPGYSLVGKKASNCAWLIVQHSGDIEFQKYCLEFIEKAVKNGESSWKNMAYLTDRILVAEGEAQIYGTQFKPENGRMAPFPIRDERNVNNRRREVGLNTLEEYTKQMNKRIPK